MTISSGKETKLEKKAEKQSQIKENQTTEEMKSEKRLILIVNIDTLTCMHTAHTTTQTV